MRSSRLLFIALLASLLLLPLSISSASGGSKVTYPFSTQAPATQPVSAQPYRPGKLLLKFKPTARPAARRAAIEAADGVEEEIITATGVRRINVPAGSELEKASNLRHDDTVDYVEPDYAANIQWTPNDPQFLAGTQWGLQRTSTSAGWDRAKGDGVTVAVIDTGADLTHPDLTANLVAGYDFVHNTATPSDDNGHGTHVSGIIAAATDNSVGGAGVAPHAKIMPLKVLGADGSGWYSDIAQGIRYAADNGARVINMSIGGSQNSQTLRDAVDYAWNRGVVLVAAAGNSNSSVPSYPAAFSNVMAVAATDSNDAKASFSNYNSYVSVAAPGVSIYSTVIGGYGYMSGTSMATPFVAGAAALVISAGDCLGIGNLGVRQAIENSTDNIDASNPSYVGQLGDGRLNAWRALPTPQPLSVSTSGLSFLQTAGGQSQQRTITINTGQCSIPWTANVTSASPQGGWLTVTPNSSASAGSTASTNVTVSASPSGLAPGNYSATIDVAYVGVTGSSQQQISVSLLVAPHLYQTTVPGVGRQ